MSGGRRRGIRLDEGAPRRGFWRRARWQAGIFGAYFGQFVKTRLVYRMDFLVDTLGVLASIAIQLAVLTALFAKVHALKGWSFEQVLFIYGFSLVPLGLFNLVSVNLYGFSEAYIIEGKFDRVLLRPVNALAQVLCESFNVSGLNEILLGLAVAVWAGVRLHLELGAAGRGCPAVAGAHGGAGLPGGVPGHHLGVVLRSRTAWASRRRCTT